MSIIRGRVQLLALLSIEVVGLGAGLRRGQLLIVPSVRMGVNRGGKAPQVLVVGRLIDPFDKENRFNRSGRMLVLAEQWVGPLPLERG